MHDDYNMSDDLEQGFQRATNTANKVRNARQLINKIKDSQAHNAGNSKDSNKSDKESNSKNKDGDYNRKDGLENPKNNTESVPEDLKLNDKKGTAESGEKILPEKAKPTSAGNNGATSSKPESAGMSGASGPTGSSGAGGAGGVETAGGAEAGAAEVGASGGIVTVVIIIIILVLMIFMALSYHLGTSPTSVKHLFFKEKEAENSYTFDTIDETGYEAEASDKYPLYKPIMDNAYIIEYTYKELLPSKLHEIIKLVCENNEFAGKPSKVEKALNKCPDSVITMLKENVEINYAATYVALNTGFAARNGGYLPTDLTQSDYEAWVTNNENLQKLLGISFVVEDSEDPGWWEEIWDSVRGLFVGEDKQALVPYITPFSYDNIFAFAGIDDVNAEVEGIPGLTYWDLYEKQMETLKTQIDTLSSEKQTEVYDVLNWDAPLIWLSSDASTPCIGNLEYANCTMAIPKYYQNGYTNIYFGNQKESSIAKTGCAITAFGMVASYYSGKRVTPDVICSNSDYNTNYASGASFCNNFEYKIASDYGFSCYGRRPFDLSSAINYVERGCPVVLKFNTSKYTTTTHFVVLCGVRNGEFIVNDPNRNNQGLSYDFASVQAAASYMIPFGR